ncbi:MAG: hypothetical protein LBK97_00565 [Prevotellaceae bacterium]|jgi:hypothetical protein|nr:hypothetical protein [Prevotellaceae bacterium]
MKIKEYYILTKPATKNCLKISGIIFTAISVIIWGIWGVSDSKSESIIEPLKIFVICFLAGNIFGLFIACLAFMGGYRQLKNAFRLYDSIPLKIRKQYEIKKKHQPLNPKYNYMKMLILSSRPGVPFLLFDRLNSDRVRIIIINHLDGKDLYPLKLKIDRDYKQEQISLTGWGLAKTLKWRKNQTPTSSEIDSCIEELITVSFKENLDIEFREPE